MGVCSMTISPHYQRKAGAVYAEWQLRAMEALGAEAARGGRIIGCLEAGHPERHPPRDLRPGGPPRLADALA